MSDKRDLLPKAVRELEDHPELVDLLYAYYEFSSYIWHRLFDYNASLTSDLRVAIDNARSETREFLKELFWREFLDRRHVSE